MGQVSVSMGNLGEGRSRSCGKKPLDENCDVARVLFREEVATLRRLSLRVRSLQP